jgi:hypothetical protein
MYLAESTRVPQLGSLWDDVSSLITGGISTATGLVASKSAQDTAAAQAKLAAAQTKQTQAQTQLTLAQKAVKAVTSPVGISVGVLAVAGIAAYFLLKKK